MGMCDNGQTNWIMKSPIYLCEQRRSLFIRPTSINEDNFMIVHDYQAMGISQDSTYDAV
jgi:hypothetical protein